MDTPIDESATTAEGTARKQRSEAVLRADGVQINTNLPRIETEGEAKRRTAEEVACRCMAVLLTALKGEGLAQETVAQVARDYALGGYFTPDERQFLSDAAPSQHHRVQFTWRYEAAWTLLWAIGYVETLQKPTAICDVPQAVRTMRERSPAQFIAGARLRPLADLLDQADLHFRYKWAVDEARIHGQPPPTSVEPGVVSERSIAFDWLVGAADTWPDTVRERPAADSPKRPQAQASAPANEDVAPADNADNAGLFFYGKPPTESQMALAAVGATATFEVEDGVRFVNAVWPDVSLRIAIDPNWDREVQLRGIRGWMGSLSRSEAQTPAATRFLAQLDKTTICYGTVIRPAYDAEGKAVATMMRILAAGGGGFLFTFQSFYDQGGNHIFGAPAAPRRLGVPASAGEEPRGMMNRVAGIFRRSGS